MMHKLNCLGKHSMRKRLQPEKSIKTDSNRFGVVWETDNPVHELTSDVQAATGVK